MRYWGFQLAMGSTIGILPYLCMDLMDIAQLNQRLSKYFVDEQNIEKRSREKVERKWDVCRAGSTKQAIVQTRLKLGIHTGHPPL